MKNVKKIVAVIIVALIAMVTMFPAMADSGCGVCGRQHAGYRCPEACRKDCSLNATYQVHLWWKCPEYKSEICSSCGNSHNELSCPNESVFWNDLTGTFQNTVSEGARRPQFCEACSHWGYHGKTECNVGAQVAPAVPSATNSKVGCTHSWAVKESEELIRYFDDSIYCREVLYSTQDYCKLCGKEGRKISAPTAVLHDLGADGKCKNCEYQESTTSNFSDTLAGITDNLHLPEVKNIDWLTLVGVALVLVMAVLIVRLKKR